MGPENSEKLLPVSEEISLASTGFKDLLPGVYHIEAVVYNTCNDTIAKDDIDADVIIGEITKISLTMKMTSSNIPMNGMVAFYPFNGNADDKSGNMNHGIVYGAVLTNDRFGKSNAAYHFDGYNDYIKIADDESYSGLNEITVSAWFKPASCDNWQVLGKFQNTGVAEFVIFHSTHYTRGWEFGIDNGSFSWEDAKSRTTAQSGKWVHVVGTFNSSIISIYINGQLKGSQYYSGPIDNLSAPLKIGTYAGSCHFKGTIDDVAIYNRALTESEIQLLYDAK
jgi:hypothetical protein